MRSLKNIVFTTILGTITTTTTGCGLVAYNATYGNYIEYYSEKSENPSERSIQEFRIAYIRNRNLAELPKSDAAGFALLPIALFAPIPALPSLDSVNFKINNISENDLQTLKETLREQFYVDNLVAKFRKENNLDMKRLYGEWFQVRNKWGNKFLSCEFSMERIGEKNISTNVRCLHGRKEEIKEFIKFISSRLAIPFSAPSKEIFNEQL